MTYFVSNAGDDEERGQLAKAREITSYVMKKARKLDGFNGLSAKEKEKVRETLERQTRLFYRDLNNLRRQVADQIEEITRKRVTKIALALKDIVAEHPNFQLAELVKMLSEKILEET